MSYQSPIELFMTDPFIETLKDETDALIVRAVANAHVEVDKEELIKALQYDRDQYLKGYTDGVLAERDKPIKTNADRIRAMTDEELADELIEWFAVFYAVEWTKDMILDWLKGAATND